MAAKVRPGLVLNVPTEPADRVLVTVVPHTTSLNGTRFEIPSQAKFLNASGAFDAQRIVSLSRTRLIRRLGILDATSLAEVEEAVRAWLGL